MSGAAAPVTIRICARWARWMLVAALLILPGCASEPRVPHESSDGKRPSGSIRAMPNPIQVCGEENFRNNAGRTGVTRLSWVSTETVTVEVHVGSPAGPLFSRSESSGTEITGNWVLDGHVFYLQDVSHHEPLTPLTTIATVTVRHTKAGCPPS